MEKYQEVERSIITRFRKEIWAKFVKGVSDYELIKENDKVMVCISGGKDSFLLAKCIQELQKHGKVKFDAAFVVMDPGYRKENRMMILKNAELLNKSSANTILKFLEEPSPNIIAILLTNNIYNCLDTIISRCQVLSLINEEKLNKNIFKKIYEKTDKKEDFDIFVEQEIKNIIDFYKRLEQDKTKLIAFYDITNLTDKIDILFDIGIKLYIDILNYKLKRNLEYFENYIDDIKNVSDFNEIGDIIRKIEIINDFQSKSSYNVNRELFVNNFIITFSGGNLW